MAPLDLSLLARQSYLAPQPYPADR